MRLFFSFYIVYGYASKSLHNVALLHTRNFDLLSDNSTYQPYENRNMLIICFILFLDISAKKYKIIWSDEGYNFTGIKIIPGTKLFDCQHGNDKKLLAKEKRKRKKIKRRQETIQIKCPLNFSPYCMSRNIVSKISVKVSQYHIRHIFFVKSITEAKKFHLVNLQREKAQILIDL